MMEVEHDSPVGEALSEAGAFAASAAARLKALDDHMSSLKDSELDVMQLLDQTERLANELNGARQDSQARRNASEAWKRSVGRIAKVMGAEEEHLANVEAELQALENAARACRRKLEAVRIEVSDARAEMRKHEKKRRDHSPQRTAREGDRKESRRDLHSDGYPDKQRAERVDKAERS